MDMLFACMSACLAAACQLPLHRTGQHCCRWDCRSLTWAEVNGLLQPRSGLDECTALTALFLQLRRLDLESNRLRGPLPATWSNLTKVAISDMCQSSKLSTYLAAYVLPMHRAGQHCCDCVVRAWCSPTETSLSFILAA